VDCLSGLQGRDKMIVYKVVNKKTRQSCSTLLREKTKYTLWYQKGKIIKKIEGTLGILCFEKKHYAESFINHAFLNNIKRAMILKVKTIGRKKIPKSISAWLSLEEINSFYLRGKYSSEPPIGTICFDKVKVLD
jgi:hypothetical protein